MRWLAVIAALLVVLVTRSAVADDLLHALRAGRRAAVREQVHAKSDAPAAFGLLVIPVDFADARFPDDYDTVAALGPRLVADARGSLADYFHVASQGHAALSVTMTPVVRLAGDRRAYSDIDYNGHSRTRALAAQAIGGAIAAGARLADADRDGDGEVDGVLLLHAGTGVENDIEHGLILPLQYYLVTPVVQDGVKAQMFAVVAARSGLGLWAHETAHLFGLEDRYDPYLPASGEVVASGGLGNFSLMAAGMWGSGDAHDPALPDAYTCTQLGWLALAALRGDGTTAATLTPSRDSGAAWRLWADGAAGPEFFVLEVRGDPRTAPYDAALPPGQLVITHIDETVAEGALADPAGPERHLRVRLVEADGGADVATGAALGDASDVFPGSAGTTALTPFTTPSSDRYGGATGIAVTGITTVPTGVALVVDDQVDFACDIVLSLDDDTPSPAFYVDVTERGWSLTDPSVSVALGPGAHHGSFAGGVDVFTSPLQAVAPGLWRSGPLSWDPAPDLPAGAMTSFDVQVLDAVSGGGMQVVTHVTRLWAWTASAAPLDFAQVWPGPWSQLYPGGDSETMWHRWSPGTGATGDGSPVLACTGAAYTSAAAWPFVRYSNRGEAILVSELLAPQVTGVRLVHHVEVEALPTGLGVDACVAEWLGPDGTVSPAIPVDGYPGRCSGQAAQPLHGVAAWTGVDSVLVDGRPRWRVDVVPVPDGPGPWRLRLHLAASPAFWERGWLVARLDTLQSRPPASAFPVALHVGDGGGVTVTWNWAGEAAQTYAIEISRDARATWQRVTTVAPVPGALQAAPVPADALAAAVTWLRVAAATSLGDVVSRAVAWSPTSSVAAIALGLPRPNPAHSEMRVQVDGGGDPDARLSIYDLRGRRVRRWRLGALQGTLAWDGRDEGGRRVAAGVYVLRLEARGQCVTRKAAWVR